jgi:hypothetical protein
MSGRPVEFVENDEMIRWCPMGAVILGGQKMHSLDLRCEEDQQRFGEVLVENECACPRCFVAYCCELESIVFARVAGRIRCKRCGFRFRWYATAARWRVVEEQSVEGALDQWQTLLFQEPRPEERETPPALLRERVAELRCPICREDLLHPIRYRRGLLRVVCRNSGCRQVWGFDPTALFDADRREREQAERDSEEPEEQSRAREEMAFSGR